MKMNCCGKKEKTNALFMLWYLIRNIKDRE